LQVDFNEKKENENFSENNKITSISVTPEQRQYLKEQFSEYRYKNQPTVKNFFMRHNTAIIWTIFAVSAIIFCSCILYDSVQGTSDIASDGIIYDEEQNQTENRPELSVSDTADEKYTTEGVAAAVRPCVVEIYTYADTKYSQPYGTGSGIIMNEDGYIITNAHVLEIDAGVQTRGADFSRSFGVTGFVAYVGLKTGF